MQQHHSAEAPLDLVVVGGGLAGLTAATVAARAGARVTLLEARSELGGRARTEDHDGFLFNQGPHALYRGGEAMRILRELGVRPSGAFPALRHSNLVENGELLPMSRPSTTGWPMLKGVMAALRSHAAEPPDQTLADWLDDHVAPEARTRVEGVFRINSYLDDPASVTAAAALVQLRRSVKGVLYLHGGWRTLVAGLRSAAADAGVRIESGAKAGDVETTPAGVAVTAGDRTWTARAVVLANGGARHANDATARRSDALTEWADAAHPATAACLDLALRRLPNPGRTAVFDIDRSHYLVVHSASATLAPRSGGALIHAMRYEPDRAPGVDHRGELESLMDLAQPGWREELVSAHFSPQLVVSHDRARPAPGAQGLPDVSVPDLPGVFVAGDWVTAHGMLADAAIGSGKRAAEAALGAVPPLDARPVGATA